MKSNGTRHEQVINSTVELLCEQSSFNSVSHRSNHEEPMPSAEVLAEVVEELRTVLFPGYYGASDLNPKTMRYHMGATLDRVHRLLFEQVMRGFCFDCAVHQRSTQCSECSAKSREITDAFIEKLPEVRRMLATDVRASYEGDPAATNPGEAIFCYPSIKAMTNFRIAHALYELGVPLIPRIITELAHSATGIDIHPGATIGEHFFMDHGTGIVIGETCRIGKNIQIYQGVTLGAKNFPMDEHGNPIKGIDRHPIIEDNVVIYSGATLLGRITIGAGSTIGGNVWLTRSVPAGSKIMQTKPRETSFTDGSGI